MNDRIALVIGSECEAMRPLTFPEALAGGLQQHLATHGGWKPVPGYTLPVINPTLTQLRSAMSDAFKAANEAQATLLIAFIGHGVTTGPKDFHLLAWNSPAEPDAESAFHLGQGIRDRVKTAPHLDGLVVLVDACQSGESVSAAQDRWVDLFYAGSGRMELLVSSDSRNSYGGCFTRTILGVIEKGINEKGEKLLCSDLIDPLAAGCRLQTAQHFSYTSSGSVIVGGGDAGLWIVSNAARGLDAVNGRPSAGYVDQLTRGFVQTRGLREALSEVVENAVHGLRAVVGPAGCGKSTLLSLLIRPALVSTLNIGTTYVDAAVFLDESSTLDSLTVELAAQLSHRVSGFGDSRRQVLDSLTLKEHDQIESFLLNVALPLVRCVQPGLRVHVVIDGLDQVEVGNLDLILKSIDGVGSNHGLSHVKIIIGVREGGSVAKRSELDRAYRIQMVPPTPGELSEALANSLINPPDAEIFDDMLMSMPEGGWLIARLLSELANE